MLWTVLKLSLIEIILFKHPNIVHVLSVFSENNTAHMVMEYEHGEPVDALLFKTESRPQSIGEWRAEIESSVANIPLSSVTDISSMQRQKLL